MVDVIKKGRLSQIYVSGGYAGLYLKAKYPGMFYAGGYVPWSGNTESLKVNDWNSYAITRASGRLVNRWGSQSSATLLIQRSSGMRI